MKPLTSYLYEFKKTYEFKIKIANIELTNDVLDRIEHALKAFEISSLSKPKRLPIADKNLDFPTLAHCEVELLIATLNYPCNDEQIRQAISKQGRLPMAQIVVIPADQPEELLRDEAANDSEDETKLNDKKAPILTKTELEDISGSQELVGMKRVESMLKELESRRMEFAAKDIPQSAKTTNDLPQNNTDPVAKKAHALKVR